MSYKRLHALTLFILCCGCGRAGYALFLPQDGISDAATTPASPRTFAMGSPTTENCREPWGVPETLHEVTITTVLEWGSTEVTRNEFDGAMGYLPPQPSNCPECPVVNVTWHEAARYCQQLSKEEALEECYSCTGSGATSSCNLGFSSCIGYRLPREAEWEEARRAGTTGSILRDDVTDCTTDSKLDGSSWYLGNSPNAGSDAQPVAQKAPNAWGLYDMAGNAWEWCEDGFVSDLGAEPVTDPRHPTPTTPRVTRGGGYNDEAAILRAAMRDSELDSDRLPYVGFRCVRAID